MVIMMKEETKRAEEFSVSDRAAEKLGVEMEAIKGKTHAGNQQRQAAILAEAVGKMLVSFCYQSEDFAAAVYEREGNLWDFSETLVRVHWTTGISDVEAYAAAVKYYMPGATVRASFRIDAPRETDDDLLDLLPEEPVKTAIILDLFDGEV